MNSYGRFSTLLSIGTVKSGSGTLSNLTQSNLAQMVVLDPLELVMLQS